MKTNEIYNKIHKLKNEIDGLYGKLIQAVLKENKNLNSFRISVNEEYDDNNYYMQVGICEINGVDLPYTITDSYEVEDIVDNDYEKSKWDSFFMASRTNADTLKAALGVVEQVPSSYFSDYETTLFTLEKPKKNTKKNSKSSLKKA